MRDITAKIIKKNLDLLQTLLISFFHLSPLVPSE